MIKENREILIQRIDKLHRKLSQVLNLLDSWKKADTYGTLSEDYINELKVKADIIKTEIVSCYTSMVEAFQSEESL